MTWTAPHTFAVGEVVSAAILNNTVSNNLLDLRTPNVCHVYGITSHSIPNNTNTGIPFDAERRKTDVGMHSTTVNPSRLICTVAGMYLITGSIEWQGNSTGYRSTFILLNTSTIIASVSQQAIVSGSAPTQQVVTTWYPLALNDFVELFVVQTSGAGLLIDNVGNYTPWMAMGLTGY